MDKIIMRGMEFYGYHGLLKEEKVLGQKFIVDVDIYADIKKAAENDEINGTIDYSRTFQRIKEVVESERYDLIEALAERIAAKILATDGVQKVMVRVKKPQAPINGIFDYMGVELIRGRSV